MSAEEFTEACVYLREEPLDPALLGALAEMLAAMANGALTKQDKRLWTPADFLGERWVPPDATPDGSQASSAPTQGQFNALFANLRPT